MGLAKRNNGISANHGVVWVCILVTAGFPAIAHAFGLPETDAPIPKSDYHIGPAVSDDKPVMLQADQIDYDQQNNIVYASGHVEITQQQTVLLADAIIYDQSAGTVQAMGHIIMLEPSGNVLFADAVALKDDMKSGVIESFKARLSDDSLFVANGAKRIDENHIELYKAAYTPCPCDRDGKTANPTWAIHAEHATIDQEKQKVSYENAYFSALGVPVLYTPYFSHPTPDAENQSGLLMAEFLQSRNLGAVFKQPIYYAIDPDKDLTLTPIVTTKEGLVLAGNYRQLYDEGLLKLDGSFTNADKRNALGKRDSGRELRGHIDAKGAFTINEKYDWGFNVRRATDETYLRLYNFSNDPFLNSRIYAQGLNFIEGSKRSYASIEGLSFQGLTNQDASALVPVVAPLINFAWQSDPLQHNARLSFDANSMALFRDRGSDSRRISGTARVNVPYVTDNGQVFDVETQLRTDIYNVSGVQLSNNANYDGTTGRVIPQFAVNWRYPFINRGENSSLLIEPITNFTISPGGGNPEKIPNEDSLLPDFNDTNLFSSQRFPGYDRVENGPRLSYGVRAQAEIEGNKYADLLLGQQYRFIDDPNFPIANDLTSDFSDYVGRVGLGYAPFDIAYRYRIDKDSLSPNRSEIELGYNRKPFTLSTSYLKLRNDPILNEREVVNGVGTVSLDENWGLIANGSRDIALRQTINTSGGVIYKNECVNITTMVGKDYTNLLDVRPSLAFWFRVSLKNMD